MGVIPFVSKNRDHEDIHGKFDMLQKVELYRGAIIR